MYFRNLVILSSFVDFFGKICSSVVESSKYLSITSGDFYLLDSTFINMNSQKYATVLVQVSTPGCCLVEQCYFSSCVSTSAGGAVCIQSSNFQSVFHKSCSYRCYINTNSWIYGQFCHVVNSGSLQNCLYFVSVTQCSPSSISKGSDPISLWSGNQTMRNVNVSQNYVSQESFGIFAQGDTRIEHCNFEKNRAYYIGFYIYAGNGIMSYSNIINNDSPNGYGVMTEISANVEYVFCVFLDNTDLLFSTTTINKVTSCWISHSYGLVGGSSRIETIDIRGYSPPYSMNMFATRECVAIHPIMKGLSTINNKHQTKNLMIICFILLII